ncbi:uncharacterized protein LOC124278554 isoform X2 [Haliotis rubra]|uniref:uncharacterized protein LOC124278554 isoform X2 n=1 Tax=Haliotis rubra TaxID=36100 RepID=UPI001EE4F192|nr:uncharacterized protein LOC124278554 isoform X2 [Haliotis rubra]
MLIYVVLALLLSTSAASGPCAPNEDLLKLLTAIHTSPSYSTMSADNRALVPELIGAAESCQLTAYIATVGFYKILDLLDSVTPAEAHFFNSYLSAHLKFEQSLAGLYTTTKPAPTHS